MMIKRPLYTAIICMLVLMASSSLFLLADDVYAQNDPAQLESWYMMSFIYGDNFPLVAQSDADLQFSPSLGFDFTYQLLERTAGYGMYVNTNLLFSIADSSGSSEISAQTGFGPLFTKYIAPEADFYAGAGLGFSIASNESDESRFDLGLSWDAGFRYAFLSPSKERRTFGFAAGVNGIFGMLHVRDTVAGGRVSEFRPSLSTACRGRDVRGPSSHTIRSKSCSRSPLDSQRKEFQRQTQPDRGSSFARI